ncbi:hypothetical protein X802_02730 [Thermococcus guaymasensis DSM 11113]|uniref:Uncharacterized protein n=1 Tax=Thermococcus guaymasensis DSM 11113 TaxID=1432656 RepID=A0A0X1KIV1_9EURY|nr:class III signal peptide-containing protein [Thermococcus guaymasensis]AJC71209.1 hypothetical protein X802_02730 [Thermococcus guaymasensis DSM 11113]
MKKGQGSPEHLVMIAVVLIVVAVVLNYILPASKGTPITGIAYIDPELSPEKPGYDHPVTWIVYKYPEGCKATKNCDFYVSVNLHYYPDTGKYKVYVYANGDENKIREIHVQLCNGKSATWYFPEDRGKNKINGAQLTEEDFPCELYVVAYMR